MASVLQTITLMTLCTLLKPKLVLAKGNNIHGKPLMRKELKMVRDGSEATSTSSSYFSHISTKGDSVPPTMQKTFESKHQAIGSISFNRLHSITKHQTNFETDAKPTKIASGVKEAVGGEEAAIDAKTSALCGKDHIQTQMSSYALHEWDLIVALKVKEDGSTFTWSAYSSDCYDAGHCRYTHAGGTTAGATSTIVQPSVNVSLVDLTDGYYKIILTNISDWSPSLKEDTTIFQVVGAKVARDSSNTKCCIEYAQPCKSTQGTLAKCGAGQILTRVTSQTTNRTDVAAVVKTPGNYSNGTYSTYSAACYDSGECRYSYAGGNTQANGAAMQVTVPLSGLVDGNYSAILASYWTNNIYNTTAKESTIFGVAGSIIVEPCYCSMTKCKDCSVSENTCRICHDGYIPSNNGTQCVKDNGCTARKLCVREFLKPDEGTGVEANFTTAEFWDFECKCRGGNTFAQNHTSYAVAING
jgi:hypothetical protein